MRKHFDYGRKAQLGWIKVIPRRTHHGKPNEKQSMKSLQQLCEQLCDWVVGHNEPFVLEAAMEDDELATFIDMLKDTITKKIRMVKE
jgi:hypothetical protein